MTLKCFSIFLPISYSGKVRRTPRKESMTITDSNSLNKKSYFYVFGLKSSGIFIKESNLFGFYGI